jgi:hypothetical protein
MREDVQEQPSTARSAAMGPAASARIAAWSLVALLLAGLVAACLIEGDRTTRTSWYGSSRGASWD